MKLSRIACISVLAVLCVATSSLAVNAATPDWSYKWIWLTVHHQNGITYTTGAFMYTPPGTVYGDEYGVSPDVTVKYWNAYYRLLYSGPLVIPIT